MSNAKQDTVEGMADLDAEISMIVDMGFTFEQASEALEASSGHIDRAIDYLVSGGEKYKNEGENKGKPLAASFAETTTDSNGSIEMPEGKCWMKSQEILIASQLTLANRFIDSCRV